MIAKIQKLREKKGFTLVELIVVIAIVAILTAVVVPLIAGQTANAAHATAQDGAQTISNTVNYAITNASASGAIITTATIVGKKTGSTLTVTGALAAETEITNSLQNTLPNDSSFVAMVVNGSVAGVQYKPSDDDLTAFVDVTGGDGKYLAGTVIIGCVGTGVKIAPPAGS